ncbi:unnamed protein product [Bemisia tabaci]|uniref:ERV/ALR sulfhydryl oxidase domain-containing protein n=2 Tax=Bemisia tabaci TaxID=7038 RepID=A0A9P0AJP3_BEMTA|nr:unnamed protein product [Bemisia tabaci]
MILSSSRERTKFLTNRELKCKEILPVAFSNAEELMRQIFETTIANEWVYSLNKLTESAEQLFNEMETFVDHYRKIGNINPSHEYVAILKRLVDRFRAKFGLVKHELILNFNIYTVPVWGHLYWGFLHALSILVQLSLRDDDGSGSIGIASETSISSLSDFVLILYNIDQILPCNVCLSHYQQIKGSGKIVSCLEVISTGYSIDGTKLFHSRITENIQHKHLSISPEYAKYSSPQFMSFDFLSLYSCFSDPIMNLRETIIKKINAPRVYWAAPHLTALVIITMSAYNVTFTEAFFYLLRLLTAVARDGEGYVRWRRDVDGSLPLRSTEEERKRFPAKSNFLSSGLMTLIQEPIDNLIKRLHATIEKQEISDDRLLTSLDFKRMFQNSVNLLRTYADGIENEQSRPAFLASQETAPAQLDIFISSAAQKLLLRPLLDFK